MKPFLHGQRVEHACSPYHGTVLQDDMTNVQVVWDDGKIGWLARGRDVAFNAYRLIALRSSGGPLTGPLTQRMHALRAQQGKGPFA